MGINHTCESFALGSAQVWFLLSQNTENKTPHCGEVGGSMTVRLATVVFGECHIQNVMLRVFN